MSSVKLKRALSWSQKCETFDSTSKVPLCDHIAHNIFNTLTSLELASNTPPSTSRMDKLDSVTYNVSTPWSTPNG